MVNNLIMKNKTKNTNRPELKKMDLSWFDGKHKEWTSPFLIKKIGNEKKINC